MFGYPGFCFGIGWWWIFPILMIALCFFMMRGRMGSIMRRPDSHHKGSINTPH